MKIIYEFLKQYNKEYDYYQKLSQMVADKIEDQLIKRGIKAEVTYRAKRPDKLKDKLVKRNIEKKYETLDDIYNDIVDLAGVRVSLYFPSERKIIDEIVNQLFPVELKKEFPESSFIPHNSKRFSGYWATHYRIALNKTKNTNKMHHPTVEIQVASVLMHAWSEVEHDMVYKPFTGNLSIGELAILDEINGLVLAGEIALDRLKILTNTRTSQHFSIDSIYELNNFIIKNIDLADLNKIRMGDTYLLFTFLKSVKKLDMKEFKSYIKRVNFDSEISLTEQMIQMLFVDYYGNVKSNLTKYFKNLNLPEAIIPGSELIVRYWVILEKAFTNFHKTTIAKAKKYSDPDFNILLKKDIITSEDVQLLGEIKQDRNLLIQGVKNIELDKLHSTSQILKGIVRKTIDHVPTETKKLELLKEFDLIRKITV
ncbi:MAG: RelA/SpoT domain-containing protein [Paludibacter sp.]|nr:RelA/SpoT domain-containing protein [Paludibacter sp.]